MKNTPKHIAFTDTIVPVDRIETIMEETHQPVYEAQKTHQ